MKNDECSCLGGAKSPIEPKIVKKLNKELLEAESDGYSPNFTRIASQIIRAGDSVWAEAVCNRAIDLAIDYTDYNFIGDYYLRDFNDEKRALEWFKKVSERDLMPTDTAQLAYIMVTTFKEIQLGKDLFQRAISFARTAEECTEIADRVCDALQDFELTRELLLKAISISQENNTSLLSKTIVLDSHARDVMRLLKDANLTRELLLKALSLAEDYLDLSAIASSMQDLLSDAKTARELFEKAEEKAITPNDFESIAYSIRDSLGDKKWVKILLDQAKNISSGTIKNEPLKKLSKLQKNTEIVVGELKAKLEKIITENIENFRDEGSFKVRPGYGPDKFYLNQVEGSYEDSLQLLIHYILYENGLYKKFLTKKQMADCETVISDYPENIYGSDDDDVQEKLDNIYGDSIEFVGKKLLSLGFDVGDDFEEYLSD